MQGDHELVTLPRRELDAILARLDGLEARQAARAPEDGATSPPRPIDRRGALKGAVLAAGAAAAGLVLGDSTPAAASNGDALIIGGSQSNVATEGTALKVVMPANSVYPAFVVYDSAYYSHANGVIYGAASGTVHDIGVFGEGSEGNGGVRGEAIDTGIGVHGISVSNVAVAGEAQSSYGVSGKSQTNIGVYGFTAGSSYAGVYGDSAAADGVHGRSVSSTGVSAESTSGYGMQAVSSNGTGLKATGKVYGVVAQSFSTSTTDAAVFATSVQANAIGANTTSGLVLSGSSDSGGGVEVKAPKFHLRLGNAGSRSAPTSDAFAHQAGEIVQSSAGETWVCVKAGTPGTWRKVAGPATSGSLHVLPAPVRVYDSRPGTSPTTGPKTPLVANAARTIDVKGNSSGVPAGATAALITVLLLNTASGNGNFTLWANGVAKPSGNTMVWGGAAGGRYTAKELSALDSAAQVQVSSSLQTDIALDVVGYYR